MKPIAVLSVLLLPLLAGCGRALPEAVEQPPAAAQGHPAGTGPAAGAWTSIDSSSHDMMILNADGTGDITTQADGTGDITTQRVTNFEFGWKQNGHVLRLFLEGTTVATGNLSDDGGVVNLDTSGSGGKFDCFPDTMIRYRVSGTRP
jgi:hypothetical protein